MALRLAAVVVGGGRAQVPQNALNDATVTAAVSHQRMLRPVRARDACRENATRLALLGEAPQGARPQRCGCSCRARSMAALSSDVFYGDTMTRIAAVAAEDAKTEKTLLA